MRLPTTGLVRGGHLCHWRRWGPHQSLATGSQYKEVQSVVVLWHLGDRQGDVLLAADVAQRAEPSTARIKADEDPPSGVGDVERGRPVTRAVGRADDLEQGGLRGPAEGLAVAQHVPGRGHASGVG